MDDSSFEQLFEHSAWAQRLALQLLGDPSEAEEVVQQAWIAALRSPPRRANRPWLARVIRNQAWQSWRSKAVRAERESEPRPSEDDEEDPAILAEHLDQQRLLAGVVLGLREPYRSTVLLRYYRELGPAEIARQQGISEETVRTRLKRALKLLREGLDRRHAGRREDWLSGMAVLAVERRVTRDTSLVSAFPGGPGASLAVFATLALTVLLVIRMQITVPDGQVAPVSEDRPADHASGLPLLSSGAEGGRTSLETDPGLRPDSPPAGAEPVAHVDVTVVDTAADSILGAEVVVLTGERRIVTRATTDSGGRARVPLYEQDRGAWGEFLSQGRFAIAARFDAVLSVRVALVEVDRVIPPPVTLVLDLPGISVRGRVVDEDGLPIVGARAQVGSLSSLNDDRKTRRVPFVDLPRITFSDADGRIELHGLRGPKLSVQLSAAGFIPAAYPLEASTTSTSQSLIMQRAMTVEGRVLDAQGRGRAGVEIWFDSRKPASWLQHEFFQGYVSRLQAFTEIARTDGQGRYSLTSVTPGSTRLWAAHPDEPERMDSILIQGGQGSHHRWDPVLSERPAFELQLLDEDREPVRGMFVLVCEEPFYLDSWRRLLRTDGQGRIRLYDVPVATVTARVTGAEHLREPVAEFPDLASSASPHTLFLESTPRTSVHARFVPPVGVPDSNVVLVLQPSQGTPLLHRSNQAGVLRGDLLLRSGTYDVTANFQGLGFHYMGQFDVVAGQELDLGEIKPPPPGHLSVLDSWPDTGVHWKLKAIPPSAGNFGMHDILASQADGSPHTRALLPGLYELLFIRHGESSHRRSILVQSGEETPLDLRPNGLLFVRLEIVRKLESTSSVEVVVKGLHHLEGIEHPRTLEGPTWSTWVGLEPGPYRARAEFENGHQESAEFEVTEQGLPAPVRLGSVGR